MKELSYFPGFSTQYFKFLWLLLHSFEEMKGHHDDHFNYQSDSDHRTDRSTKKVKEVSWQFVQNWFDHMLLSIRLISNNTGKVVYLKKKTKKTAHLLAEHFSALVPFPYKPLLGDSWVCAYTVHPSQLNVRRTSFPSSYRQPFFMEFYINWSSHSWRI